MARDVPSGRSKSDANVSKVSSIGKARSAAGAGAAQVAVLFLDVVGSNSLSQHLYPEEVHAVMDDVLQRGTGVVADHGGKVLGCAGDSLLAAFVAEQAREDDTERAVRSGPVTAPERCV